MKEPATTLPRAVSGKMELKHIKIANRRTYTAIKKLGYLKACARQKIRSEK